MGKTLPLRGVYKFAAGRDFENEVSAIKVMDIEWDLSYTSTLRRGYIVELLEQRGLFSDFKETHWPDGNTEDGERQVNYYKKIKQMYDDFLDGNLDEAGDNDDTESDKEFAAEDDLRDFLANNLDTIEPGLTLFQDDAGKNGVEYRMKNNGRSIDILANDSAGRLVVIELKVSKGLYQTVGQIATYMGWVDKNLISNGDLSRGMIIAKEISQDLELACQRVVDLALYQYHLRVKVEKVDSNRSIW